MTESLTFTIDMLAAVQPTVVISSGVALLALGLVFVIVLTVAYARLRVEQDPKVEALLNVLPGANCGGCGLAGCSAYAEAVVADHGLMGKCGPGGEELVHHIGAILGIEAAAAAPVRPIVHCSAHTDDLINSTKYQGVPSCGEAQIVSGAMGCPYGCLGMGDCSSVCQFDAISMVDGLATVDYAKCVGCGACVKACPRQLIELVDMQEDPLLVIACSSRDKAKDVRSYCQVGCIGCTACAKQAPDALKMQDNLPILDYEKYPNQEDRDKATGKCPRAMMVYVGQNVKTNKDLETESKQTVGR